MDSKTLINTIKQWLQSKDAASVEGIAEPPIPTELFHADQMERHGITLALSHALTQKNVPDMLLNQLSESEALLIKSRALLIEKNTDDFSPAREWLLDNYYLVQEQIYAIRRHLPKGYGNALPQLAGSISGYPRVYDIAVEIIEHGDGRWDLENLQRFITAYQSITPLTLGELWAIPITLGVALIKNLSSVSQRIVADRNDHHLAKQWADRMVEVAVSEPKKLVVIIADMARANPPMSSAFVAEFTRRLQGAALALPISWMEQNLLDEGLTIAQLVQDENRYQAANQATVSNCIGSLRRLGEINWRDFVESMSVVEETLRTDPSATYKQMDFATRDRYRHVVERLSRSSKRSELEVATCAIQLAKTNQATVSTEMQASSDRVRYSHVGFYLIDNGLAQLENALGITHSWWKKCCRYSKHYALSIYLCSILLITSGIVYAMVYKAHHSGVAAIWVWLMGIALAVYGSQIAMTLVNLAATLLVSPKALPRMNFSKGIPAAFRSLVVVPAMLNSAAQIESMVEALEVRFLGNRDAHLYFMLLTDFNDASTAETHEDAALLAAAQELITALNQRYPQADNDIFFLCHRPRTWNANENCWMGKERKRGKLTDLNNLLRENNQTPFLLIVGRTEILSEIKYVITLDGDTQLPRETARQFVATMVHPLNQPRLNANLQRVVEGYGILQPRVAEALSLTGLTRYARLCGNDFGVDPYTRTVSDVYQDIFQEGSFIGKGIYDVDVFQRVLGKRLPDNRILSHDLLEGCYLRSGLLSDVPLYEKSPGNYLSDVQRRARWIRGDWQIAGWLLPYVFNAENRRIKNPLSVLSKLKIVDNLRRSVVPIALLMVFGLSLSILPTTVFWLTSIFLLVVFPVLIKTLLELLRKPDDMLPGQHVTTIFKTLYRCFGQLLLYLACLPYEAWYSFKAILITGWRSLVSKRHLLEWVPSDQVDQKQKHALVPFVVSMWVGPAVAVLIAMSLMVNGKWHALLLAMPLLTLWFTSPLIVCWLSQPFHRKQVKLAAEQIRFLHTAARKTWGFFETFITAENHWLPPDNFQEAPVEVVARRTSPTNIGLSLLANITAYDFGYITIAEVLTRTANTLQTVGNLERYRGHLYNWYNTETLAPLLPRYVSSVDSGNLAGHLLTLQQALLGLADEPLLNPRYLAGLQDTYAVLAEIIQSPSSKLNTFQQLLETARTALDSWPEAVACCNALCLTAEKLVEQLPHSEGAQQEIEKWAQALLLQCQALQTEIILFANVSGITVHTTLRDITSMASAGQDTIPEAKIRMQSIEQLALQAYSLAQMDVSFLYDEASHLMTIGFNVDTQKRDESNYDLLCSEARLGSFVAIAQGKVQQESWFALGRLLASRGGESILISWSGSMFEYLMPLLVMPTYPDTLLDQTYHGAVSQQIAYGKQCGVPWGISESGYNAVDTQFNYLYRAFGVPGLGLKRGLEDDLVIAPYASAMALMVNPIAACQNLQRLAKENALGKFGFYEAIDFTVARLPPDRKKVLVRSFMTHHQGMSFLAFSYLLHGQPMQKRFAAEPLFQAALLLLQERIPKPMASYLQIPKSTESSAVSNRPEASMRVFTTPNTRTPQVQLLSNGGYHVLLTQAGGGYSRWKDIAITRWREDSTSDNWGLFSYVRDVLTGEFWSTNYQPTVTTVENFRMVFSEGHAEFSRSDHGLDLHTEVVVSPEDDIELRRLRMHNRTKTRRTIEFTSYGEIVLTSQASDLAQPAFSNLFVETEILPEQQAILATRRSQDGEQHSLWLCHLLNVYSKHAFTLSFETDRAQFVGRGRTLAAPLAMQAPGHLSNTEGAVLDPIFSIRCQLTLEPDALVIFDLLTGVADTRPHCIALVEKYQDRNLANRIFGLAWTHSQVLLHHLNITELNAQLYGKLASAIVYASSTRRADSRILASNHRGQSSLWGYSISGDIPIVLLRIEDAANIALVQQLIQAQAYWRHKGLLVDLVILNEEHFSYRQTLQEQIMNLVTGNTTSDHGGNIVVRLIEHVPAEDQILLQSVARVILSDKRGTLKEQLSHRRVSSPVPPLLSVSKSARRKMSSQKGLPIPADLQFFNGFGGFNSTGDEYFIQLEEDMPTPAPWVNVIANPHFGTVISESGQSYTWIENAHEFRLTPWDNDPVQDTASEAFYLRDDETGRVWSPTALPCRGRGSYQVQHGFGYSIFKHNEENIYSELCVYVAEDAPVKFVALKVRNDSSLQRRLSATGYVAWVLGDVRAKQAMHVVTELTSSGALIAQNHYNTEFGERTAFFDAVTNNLELIGRTVTGDRAEFLGRNGTCAQPAALKRKRLSGRVGAGLDPCGAIQFTFDLAEGQSRDIIFTLGAGQNRQEADALITRYHGTAAAQAALTSVRQYWHLTLNTVQVMTPDPALNLLANGWLLYQVLSSRLWGRAGYYQSGGAFGFRDQLQDVMALAQVAPKLFRAHILLCAEHQFEEGDVQHWWHPPQNRGVRTRCSDDFLWLPFALCHYVQTTGDKSLLDEAVPFLQGRPLKPDEESYYELPTIGSKAVSVYQHAVRAINHGLTFGVHGLPLMGSGDWNDGMNRVGKDGKGESIWLGFFLYSVLKQFAPLAVLYGDNAFAAQCEVERNKLQSRLETEGWDGEWYRRAYFDDGTPLGSASNSECRIDSIAQSWSVLSEAANPEHAKNAMSSLHRYLVNAKEGLVKLLDPPFVQFQPNPGYIQGYVAGIRENGGQYTHAATWAAMAFAKLGETERAWELFNIINPVNHGRNSAEVNRYKIEPYVVAGDVYSVAPHTGRGGWSWYTGSAGWLYRLTLETLLGIQLIEGKYLQLTPILPDAWDSFSVDYLYARTRYKITITRGAAEITQIVLDDVMVDENRIPLLDDGKVHRVMVTLGNRR